MTPFNSFFGRLSPPIKIFLGAFILGFMLKTQRLLYGQYIIASAAGLITLFSIFELLRKPKSPLTDYTVRIFVSSFSISFALGVLHYPYRLPFTILATLTIIFHFIREQFFRKRETIQNQRANDATDKNDRHILRYTSVAVIVIGIVLKILHLVGADILIVIGLVLLSIALIISVFKK